MKILFSLDVKLNKIKDKYFTSGAADYEYFNKHKIFPKDQLNVICRSDNITYDNKMATSSGENITFYTVDSYFKLFKHKTKKDIKEFINKSDLCLIKLPTIIGCFVCHYAKKAKKRYVVEMVGDPFYSLKYRGDLVSKLIAPLIRIINRHYIKNADVVVYVSKNYLQDGYPTKGLSLSLSDVNLINCDKSTIENRYKRINSYNKKTTYRFGIIGSLNVRYKGLDTALLMISELKKDYANIELHILGSGDKKYWNKKIKLLNISDNVFFDGIIEHKDIFNWFDRMDFFLMPSLTEGLPRSLIEAMSRGCLCVASNVGGIPELLDFDVLINPKDYMKMKKIVLNMIENHNYSINQSKRNVDFSNDFLSEKLVFEKGKINEIILREVVNCENSSCSK